MADDVLVDNGAEADFTVSADDASGKMVQRVKLAVSADGSATHIPADADGLLVNLGTNNDVTVSGVATEATLADVLTDTGGILTELQGTLDVSGSVTADTELTTADLDTGAGTDTRAVVGLVRAESGGATLVGSANPLPVSGTVTVTDGSGSLTVDGTVTANLAAGTNNIGDVDVLTMPGTFAEDAAHNSGDTGVFILGVRNTAMSTRTTADDEYSPISVDSAGRVNVVGGVAHDSPINGLPVVVGAVASAAAPSDISNDQDAVRIWALRNGAQVVNVAAGGTLITGDGSNGLDVDVTRLPALVAGSALIGAVNLRPTTANGLSIFRSIDLDETEEDVKTSAGQLYGYYLWNGHSAVLYVKFYNATAANVTVGSTTPVLTIPVPPGSAANVEFTNGIAFSTAITAACTTGVADADTGAPGANLLVANVFYA